MIAKAVAISHGGKCAAIHYGGIREQETSGEDTLHSQPIHRPDIRGYYNSGIHEVLLCKIPAAEKQSYPHRD